MPYVQYVTLKPPLFEVVAFPRYGQRKYEIDEFLEWSGYVRAQKRRGLKEWDLWQLNEEGSYVTARPGDEFIRIAGEPDQYRPAIRHLNPEKFEYAAEEYVPGE